MSQWESSMRVSLRFALLAVIVGLLGGSNKAVADGFGCSFGHGWGGGYSCYGGPGYCRPGYCGPGYCGLSIGWGCAGGYSLPLLGGYGCYGSPVYYGGTFGGYPYGTSTWSCYGWGVGGYAGSSFYSTGYPVYPPLLYPAVAPVRLPTQDGWPAPQVWDVLHQQEQGILANDPALLGNQPAPQGELDRLRFMPPSTPEAIIASQRNQDQGDVDFQQFRLAAATDEYRDAIAAAPERAEPYFRLAVTLSARRQFLEAVDVLQQLLVVDPEWPVHGTQLAEMFRAGDVLPKTQIKQRVADWVLEDVRDADRLFLLGVFLYSDGDRENAATLLETAALIEGQAEHLAPFLNPIRQVGGQVVEGDAGFIPLRVPANQPQVVPALPDLVQPGFGPRFGP